jgi:hypothetical protein
MRKRVPSNWVPRMAVMHEFPVKYRCEYALQQALSYAIVQSDLAPVFDGSSRCNRAAEQSSLLRLRCGNRVRNISVAALFTPHEPTR